MAVEPDSMDDLINSSTGRFTKPVTGGLLSTHLSGDPAFPPRVNIDRDTGRGLSDLRRQVQSLSRQLGETKQQLADERFLTQRLLALNEFGKEADSQLNPERSAQSMARLVRKLVPCELICIYSFQQAEQRFKLLASGGPSAHLISASNQPDLDVPAIRLALQTQRMVCSRDLGAKNQPWRLSRKEFPNLIAAPLVSSGLPRGLVILAEPGDHDFALYDALLIEAAAARLLQAWEASRQNETLTEFVQTIGMMSVVQEIGSLLEVIATIARRALNASYTVVATQYQHQEWQMRESGHAPRLYQSLHNGGAAFLQEALVCPYTIHVRDLRNEPRAASLQIDGPELRTLLASPIRIAGSAQGVLLAFGKNGESEFTEMDIFLAELLASQAAVNLDSCYLNQELRGSLKTTQLLYDLSLSIVQADSLTEAARVIALSAYRLFEARKCGLILLSPDQHTEAQVIFPSDAPGLSHPYTLIQQAMESRQTIYLSESEQFTRLAIPIQTLRRCYGALWMEIDDQAENSVRPHEEIRILINQAAVALERSILLQETRHQANRLVRAYDDLLVGLTKALDVRDRETEDHSQRVRDLAVSLGLEMGLSSGDLRAIKHGALLHDIGKIGVKDSILRKRGPLDEDEWQEMRQHPQIGAQIIQEIPYLHDALPVIAFHQERWDGSGYPAHLRGTDIPLVARVFAVIDVYDALTSDRPYRSALSQAEAFDYLENQSGSHFDPDIVQRFIKMMRSQGAQESLSAD